ncbi:major royal jelly protein 2-like [Euwallacea similis]|uniref:major royal jelly protein 2-like n=1 Tax=Euwallacea similis TaxID=1736056 RepID=UPI00344BCF55
MRDYQTMKLSCVSFLYGYLLILALLYQGFECSKKKYNFELIYQWKQIEYKFRNEAERSEAIANGSFNVGKIQTMDAQYTFDASTNRERIFITTPKLTSSGVPATFGTITNETRDGNPVIDPYPSWSWQLNPENCRYHRIVSVFRVWADECNRLWIADNGIVGDSFVCPPQLLAFDLRTDELLYKYEVPYDQYLNVSWFISPMAEIESFKNRCENTWVYVADTNAPSMLVYSLKQNTSWRVQDRSFDPDPNYNVYTIGGDSFVFADGIITVALSPPSHGLCKRKLHYHAMSNINESWVYVKDLKNRSNFAVPYGSPHLFHTYKDKRNQQSVTEAIDQYGNIYFSLLTDVELLKWNPNTAYKRENFELIANDKKTMQFPSGLKVVPYRNTDKEVLWMFSVAYQRYEAKTLNGTVVNFRLFRAFL